MFKSIKKHYALAVIFIVFFLFLSFLSSPAFSSSLAGGFDRHKIEVTLDISQGRVYGKDTLSIAADSGARLRLLMDKNVRVKRVELSVDSSPLAFEILEHAPETSESSLIVLSIKAPAEQAPITIFFESTITQIESAQDRIERGVFFSGTSAVGEKGAFLPASSYWFARRPFPFAYYEMLVTLPRGFTAVMEGERLRASVGTKSQSVAHYKSDTPSDGINLVAARFVVKSERYKGIDILTYFYSDDEELSRTYIEKTKFYIDAYEELLPPYPYKKFAIVENFLPTGFGMPSFTLLGSAVLRLPFIPDTALGHEFAHNWWGNGVFIDSSKGNWAEALATYTADHYFKERAGAGEAASYRMRALTNYANYAGSSEKPVSSFAYGTSVEARAIGYSKAMMIFHMLNELVGDELFYLSLKKFYEDNAFTRGSWDDIRRAFEDVSERELGWFFSQWLNRSSGPRLKIEEPVVTNMLSSISTSEPAYRLRVVLRQEKPVYRLRVPIYIETETGKVRGVLNMSGERKEVSFELKGRPRFVEVDPETDIFRILPESELPPSLAVVLGTKESKIIVPDESRYRSRYKGIAKSISKDYGLEILNEAEIRDEDLSAAGASYLILGSQGENAIFKRVKGALPEELKIGEGYFTVDGVRYETSDSVLVATFRVGGGGRTVALLFGALSARELKRIGERITHLTNKGFLIFSKGGGLKYGVFEGEKSLRYEFER